MLGSKIAWYLLGAKAWSHKQHTVLCYAGAEALIVNTHSSEGLSNLPQANLTSATKMNIHFYKRQKQKILSGELLI